MNTIFRVLSPFYFVVVLVIECCVRVQKRLNSTFFHFKKFRFRYNELPRSGKVFDQQQKFDLEILNRLKCETFWIDPNSSLYVSVRVVWLTVSKAIIIYLSVLIKPIYISIGYVCKVYSICMEMEMEREKREREKADCSVLKFHGLERRIILPKVLQW